ncbi:MAG: hypothetical protein KVP17_004816 [Porospora cf. gigantea B]|uniref:uncharacterized protein n=1 Tax=Porospora cf. gigantea B TaxID=2853592 RepID=UPI003571836F|nr:MAG: hypothetical protein KVP17_004816 [Porospora cf. gigantea B]
MPETLADDMTPVRYRGNHCVWSADGVVTPVTTPGWLEFSRREGLACILQTAHPAERKDDEVGNIYAEGAYLVRIKACTTGRAFIVVPVEMEVYGADAIKDNKDAYDLIYLQESDPAKDLERLEEIHSRILVDPARMPAEHRAINETLCAVKAVSLRSALTADIRRRLMTNKAAVAEIARLLPDNYQSTEDLEEALRSSEMGSALDLLEHLIRNDKMGFVLRQFGVDESNITKHSHKDKVAAFLDILSEAFKDEPNED